MDTCKAIDAKTGNKENECGKPGMPREQFFQVVSDVEIQRMRVADSESMLFA